MAQFECIARFARVILGGTNSGFTGQYIVNSYLQADEGKGLGCQCIGGE